MRQVCSALNFLTTAPSTRQSKELIKNANTVVTDVDPQMFSRDCVVAIEASHRQRLEDKADVGRWIYSMTTQFRVDAWFVVHPCHASWVENGNVESVLTIVLDELDNLTVQPATRSFRPMSM